MSHQRHIFGVLSARTAESATAHHMRFQGPSRRQPINVLTNQWVLFCISCSLTKHNVAGCKYARLLYSARPRLNPTCPTRELADIYQVFAKQTHSFVFNSALDLIRRPFPAHQHRPKQNTRICRHPRTKPHGFERPTPL